MLREDKGARIERISGRRSRPWKSPVPDHYEFSVGKYTRSGNPAKTYLSVVLQAGAEALSETQLVQPVLLMHHEGRQWWWYLNRFYRDDDLLTAADVQALVLQRERRKQATLAKAHADVFGVQVIDEAPRPKREPIPESVRHEVWRRDEGQCVDCGSREKLEFDHIVPLSKGGSNTARNIELRCESCNRRKGATI